MSTDKEEMIRKPALIVFICLAVVFSGACSLTQVSSFFGAYPEESGALLFQDGFENPSSGWDRVRTDSGMTDYEQGRYRIVVDESNADYWSNPGLDFTDVVVEVEAEKLGGPDDNNFGILCRYQDVKNFYFFIISSDGYYGLGKVENGKQSLLEPPQMYFSESILPGDQINRLRVECKGTRLALIVNNVPVAEAEDAAFQDGDVGLIVGSFDEPGVDIAFDSFLVTVP